MRRSGSLALLPASGRFLSVGLLYPTLIRSVLLHLVVFYFVMFGFYLLEAHSLLMRHRKGLDLDERQWGGTGGRQGGNCIQTIWHDKKICLIKGTKTVALEMFSLGSDSLTIKEEEETK